MANPCTNMFRCTTEDKSNLEKVANYLEKTFDTYHLEVEEDDGFLEAEFSSKWSFPTEEMETITNQLKTDDTLYIRCLSYEFGCDYVDYMIFDEGEWYSKI